MYAAEGVDNDGHVLDQKLPLAAEWRTAFDGDLLGGIEVLSAGGVAAVPYYAWANRGKGEMAVWLPFE